MQENYDKCLKAILHHEGGYVNHPKDPGGETNLGVTKRVYEEWCMTQDLVTKDMKELTVEDVAPIYKKGYWDKMKGDDLPSGLDLCVFDFGVNAGPGRSAKYLQTMIGTVADGGIGPNTLKAVDAYVEEHGIEKAVENFQEARQGYYEKLSTFDTFGKGWTRRVTETTELAKSFI
jgi:lysozyme family protein